MKCLICGRGKVCNVQPLWPVQKETDWLCPTCSVWASLGFRASRWREPAADARLLRDILGHAYDLAVEATS